MVTHAVVTHAAVTRAALTLCELIRGGRARHVALVDETAQLLRLGEEREEDGQEQLRDANGWYDQRLDMALMHWVSSGASQLPSLTLHGDVKHLARTRKSEGATVGVRPSADTSPVSSCSA